MGKIGMIVLAGLVTGCSTPVTDRMDTFFNSLNRPREVQPDPMEYKNKPGYAPAYPPFNRFEQSDPFSEQDVAPEPTRLY